MRYTNWGAKAKGKPELAGTKRTVISGRYELEDIVNHSKNIIDLIEVGDYVNGYKVLNVYDNYIEINNPELLYDCIVYEKVRENNIKSILTKEQYKSVEYVF